MRSAFEPIVLAMTAADKALLVAPCRKGVGESVIGLKCYGPFQKRQRLRCLLRCRRGGMRDRTQNEIVGVEVLRTFALHPFDFSLPDVGLNRGNHVHRYLVLEREYILQIAVIAFGPEVAACRSFNKLRADAHPRAHLSHTALKDIPNAERWARGCASALSLLKLLQAATSG